MNKIKILKAIVFIFTFLLIFGTIVFIHKFTSKLKTDISTKTSQEDIYLPSTDATISQIQAQNNLLYILTSSPISGEKIFVIDTNNNKIAYTIHTDKE